METSLVNIVTDANLIVDCDEILVNISPLWVRKLLDNRKDFEEYLNLDVIHSLKDNEYFDKLILRRKKFYITDWLKKEGVEEIPEEVIKKFMDLYNDDEDYYQKLQLTKLARGMINFSYHPSVKRIYVVTRCTEGANYKGKLKLIESIFPKLKLEIITVPSGHKKSEYIKDINIKNGIIFEDELCNINDYLDNAANVTECSIYVPKLGYNIPNMDLIDKAEKKKVTISYYEVD